MLTSSCKAKGRRLQGVIREAILKLFPALEPDDVKVALMGESGCDIKLSPAARKVFPYSVEAKNQEKLAIWSALKQAEDNTVPGTVPLLVFGRNRTEPYVALKFDDFIKLLGDTPCSNGSNTCASGCSCQPQQVHNPNQQ